MFAMAVSNQHEVGRTLISDLLQPQQTGSLYGALSWDKMRSV